LLKNLNSFYNPSPSFQSLGRHLLFRANTPGAGEELWVSQGQASNTFLLKDLNPGPGGSSPKFLASYGPLQFLTATDGRTGNELWITDGTPRGTRFLKDIYPSSKSSSPEDMIEFEGRMFFSAFHPSYGRETWVTDGTPLGTSLAFDLTGNNSSSNPEHYAAASKFFFFTAELWPYGRELWRSGGTSSDTKMVYDIRPGSWSGAFGPIVVSKNRAFFTGDDGTFGPEPWVSDGSPSGTKILKDLNPGLSGSNPEFLGTTNDRVLFTAETSSSSGRILFATDGTASGTLPLFTLPEPIIDLAPASKVFRTGSRFAFLLTKHGRLIRTDGTRRGTAYYLSNLKLPTEYTTFNPPPPPLVALERGKLFLSADDGRSGFELWVVSPGASGRPVGYGCPTGLSRNPRIRVEDLVLGSTARVEGDSAPPAAKGLLLLGTPVDGKPYDASFLGRNCKLYFHPFLPWMILGNLAADKSGKWSSSIRVPNAKALIGVEAALQAAFPGKTLVNWELTNGWLSTIGL